MIPRSWFRKLFARPAARPDRKAPARCRPALELLEDRTVPFLGEQSLFFRPLSGPGRSLASCHAAGPRGRHDW